MILTKELFEKGLKSGKYIGKAQCLLFGIPFVNNKKQKKEIKKNDKGIIILILS